MRDLAFNQNDDQNKQLVWQLRERLKKAALGGGQKRLDAHRAKGKLTARDRIAALLDPSDVPLEIGALAGEGMYQEHGGAPGGGVVVVIGRIKGRQAVVVANDATVKAGAWFPITGKKNLRAQEIAIENRLPIVYLVDSAGVYLPMQDEIFPDKEHFGRIFRNNAVMSSMGLIQIAAIMGPCVAGGAYLPIMSDEALIVDGSGSVFLPASARVTSAPGASIDNETRGGATTPSQISGVTDYQCKDDHDALTRIRAIFDKLGEEPKAGFNRAAPAAPALDERELYGVFPTDRVKPYDMHDIMRRLVDNSEFEEYKEGYGQTLLCGLARIDGWAVGIVANQRKIVKSKKTGMQMGGVIYNDSADKAARFIMNCNQKKIPLVFLHDVSGFMVGSQSEHSGIIKDGAKMVSAMANSVVPKFTIVLGNSYGAGNYAMCGKAYDPRLIFAWPTAQLAVMSGAAAANTLLQIQVASLKAKGEEISPEAEKELLDRIKARYDEQLTPYYAAARLWVDGIIDPLDTRRVISEGISAANHAPITRPYNVGVIQT